MLPGSGAVIVAAPPASPLGAVVPAVGRVTADLEVELAWITVVTCKRSAPPISYEAVVISLTIKMLTLPLKV